MITFEIIQLAIFTLGVITIIIAGLQDKKNRIAPAIYFSPTLIGFGINPLLGLVGLVGTMIALFLYKDSWNQKLGLADLLLFFTLLIGLFNPLSLFFIILIIVGFLLDLNFLQQNITEAPLVWIFAKWILIIGVIVLAINLIL